MGLNFMEISFDKKADALYIEFRKGEFDSNKKIDEDIVFDLDKKGNLLGIEFLSVSKRIPPKELEKISVNIPA